MQLVDASLQQLVHAGTRLHAAAVERNEQCLQFVAQITHRGNSGHSGTALERVQMALEFLQGLPRTLVPGPQAERLVCRLQEFRRFLGKDRGDFLVVIGLHVLGLGDDRRGLAFRDLLFRQLGNGSVGLQGIRKPGEMVDERSVVRPILDGLVDIADDGRDRFRGRLQGIDTRLLEADLVVIDTPYQAVQRARDRHTPLDVCHVGAAVQRMARAIQLVGDLEGRLAPVAGLQIIDDDLEVPGRFLGEYVEQYRIHFQRRLCFLRGLRGHLDREHGGIGIAVGKRVRTRHQQTDVAARLGTDLELFDQLGNGGRRLQDEIHHRRRADQCAIDQFVEEILDGPAILADPLGADHAAAAL